MMTTRVHSADTHRAASNNPTGCRDRFQAPCSARGAANSSVPTRLQRGQALTTAETACSGSVPCRCRRDRPPGTKTGKTPRRRAYLSAFPLPGGRSVRRTHTGG
jgi:hypothetical protein